MSGKKGVDFARVLEKKRKNPGLTMQDLGELFGVSRQAISQLFQRHGIAFDGEGDAVKLFEDNRPAILKAKQMQTLAHLTDEKLEKCSGKDLALIYGILHDKERDLKGAGNRFVAVFFQLQAAACEIGAPPIEVEGREVGAR